MKSHVRIPGHVVRRRFHVETVVLNLDTGKYHGMNSTGGLILDLLEKLGSVQQASAALANEYALPPEQAASDVCDFCAELEERDLIVLTSTP